METEELNPLAVLLYLQLPSVEETSNPYNNAFKIHQAALSLLNPVPFFTPNTSLSIFSTATHQFAPSSIPSSALNPNTSVDHIGSLRRVLWATLLL